MWCLGLCKIVKGCAFWFVLQMYYVCITFVFYVLCISCFKGLYRGLRLLAVNYRALLSSLNGDNNSPCISSFG